MKPKTRFSRSFEKNENNNRPQVHYSLEELRALVAQENSCVTCISCNRSVDLAPMHLKDLKASVKEKLNTRVTKYDVELGGVVLAHKNIKIIPSSIRLSDNRLFPVGYVADVFIFTPTVGKILTGVVNKISATDNVYSVLVHNLFNVAVHTDRPLPLTLGSSVDVQVSFVDFTGRLLYIRAKYCHPEGSAELNDSQPNADTPDAPVDTGDSAKEKKKKKKKKSTEIVAEPPKQRELHSILKNSSAGSSAEPSASSESEPNLSSILNDSRENGQEIRKIKLKKPKHKSKNSPKKEPEPKQDDKPSKKRKRTSESTDDSDVFLTPPPWLDEKRKKMKLNSPNESTSKLAQNDKSTFNAPTSSTPLNGNPSQQVKSLLQDQLAEIKEELQNRQDEAEPEESKNVAKIVTKMEKVQSDEVPKRKKKREKKLNGSAIEHVADITKQMLEQALLNIKGE